MWFKERMNEFILQDEDYVVREVVSSASSSVLDSIIDVHSAIKILAITVTAELVAFAMFYVSKDKVQESLADPDSGLLIYGSIACFVIGFLTAFAVYRIIERKLPRSVPKITIWLLSTAAGIANLALFYMLANFQMR